MTPDRRSWKVSYRILRIIRRETRKAIIDMDVFGTGAVYVGKHGDPWHVPAHLQILKSETP